MIFKYEQQVNIQPSLKGMHEVIDSLLVDCTILNNYV